MSCPAASYEDMVDFLAPMKHPQGYPATDATECPKTSIARTFGFGHTFPTRLLAFQLRQTSIVSSALFRRALTIS